MKVAKIREMKTDSNPLVLKIARSGGHFGEGGMEGHTEAAAEEIAFLMDQVGWESKTD